MASLKEMMGLNRADFGTVEKDFADITNRIMSNEDVVKLLYYNTPDALQEGKTKVTEKILNEVATDNIRIVPSLRVPENKGSYLIITFDSFTPNANNPEFMNNLFLIDVLCPSDVWMMDSYMMRPFRIMHELQRMFNDRPLNGIGKAYLLGASLLNLGDYTGYQMAFSVINDV